MCSKTGFFHSFFVVPSNLPSKIALFDMLIWSDHICFLIRLTFKKSSEVYLQTLLHHHCLSLSLLNHLVVQPKLSLRDVFSFFYLLLNVHLRKCWSYEQQRKTIENIFYFEDHSCAYPIILNSNHHQFHNCCLINVIGSLRWLELVFILKFLGLNFRYVEFNFGKSKILFKQNPAL